MCTYMYIYSNCISQCVNLGVDYISLHAAFCPHREFSTARRTTTLGIVNRHVIEYKWKVKFVTSFEHKAIA